MASFCSRLAWGGLIRSAFACMSCGADLGAGKYQTSLLKAFQRTVDDARFAVVVVDAPNLRVEDVKPYWAAGQVLCARDASSLITMHCRNLVLCSIDIVSP